MALVPNVKSLNIILLLFNFVNNVHLKYGEYKLEIINYELEESVNFKKYLSVDYNKEQLDNSKWTVSYHIVVKKPMGVLGIKLKVFMWNVENNKFVPTLNVVMKNACEKYLAAELLAIIPALGKNCTIKEGDYKFSINDLETFSHSLTNGKFFFGKYLVLTDILAGNKGRCMRSNVTVAINPLQ